MRLTASDRNPGTPISRVHRSPRRLLGWFGLFPALMIALLATCCQAARAAGTVDVKGLGNVLASGGVGLSTLPGPDVTNGTYSVITALGSPATSVTVTDGYTLDTVLGNVLPAKASGLTSATYSYLSPPFGFAEIAGPDGHSSLVSYGQITNTSAQDPPVIWGDASGTHFADGNPADYISEPGATGEITILLHTGSILTVTASTTTTGTIDAGKPVDFKLDAPVTGQAPGESLTYEWTFDDGSTSPQPTTTHKYLLPGTYDAYLRVSGSHDSLGFSAVIPITVGKAPKGPNRKGGGTAKKKQAPTSGAGVKGTGGKKSSTKKKSSGTTTTPSTTTTGTTPNTTTTATTPNTPVKPAVSHHATTKKVPATAGPLLSGIALGVAATPPAATVTPPAKPARPGVSNPARTGHLTPPGHGPDEGFWIVLCALATLCGGAVIEAYGPNRRSWLPRIRELRRGLRGYVEDSRDGR